MTLDKLALPRRSFLRGTGAALALPLLDAMVPAATALSRTAAQARHHLGFVYAPSGMPLHHWLPRKPDLTELSTILAPLSAHGRSMVVISGLSNTGADDPLLGSGPHTRCGSAWLSGVRPKRTEGADIASATTLDQHCAPAISGDTPLRSLELALETSYAVGNCDAGYSCTYINTFSWKTPTTPLPMENNPRLVFERLFGDGGTTAERLSEWKRDRSILDFVTGDLARLQKSIGPGDKATVDGYLSSIRDVERRIQRAEKQAAESTVPLTGQPVGIPDAYDVHARLMLDLMHLAYQADITRVGTFQLNREQSAQNFPWIGVEDGHHDASHHGGNAKRMDIFARINTYHTSLFAYLVDKMAATPDGDGTLLDHSMLMFGSGMGDGSVHSPHDVPIVLVGGGNGALKGGRHVTYPLDTPLSNLLVTIAGKVGVNVPSIGDSTGPLASL